MRLKSVRRSIAAGVVGAAALLPGTAVAQPVLLEIRPVAGDTVHLRLEQTVEMKGTTRIGTRDSTMSATTRMAIVARAIVLSADSAGARVLAVTDSVLLDGSDSVWNAAREESRRALEGSRVEMRILPDGSSDIVPGSREVMNELRGLMAEMPASLPSKPVQVGERWTRVVTVPVADQGGVPRTESLKTTFRFDSLSRNREIAYVSLLGEISRSSTDSTKGPPGVEIAGTIRGSMIVDRKRGWMKDSRAVITLKSVLPPAPGSKAHPMRFDLTITQRMRALDKR